MIFFAVWVLPQLASSYNNGSNDFPALVKEYSTLGGISVNSILFSNPYCSNSFNSPANTLFEIDGMIWFSFPNRIVLSPIQFSMMGFHLPPMILIVRVTGQFNGLSMNLLIISVTFWLLVFTNLVTNVYHLK